MQPVVSVTQMRASDVSTIARGVPARELLRRAGEAIFAAVEREAQWRAPVGIVCGAGNNAGDGYVLALLLHKRGVDCTLYRVGERCSPDGAWYLERCRERGIPERTGLAPDECRTVVDCIFGTGFHGVPEGAERRAIEAINAAHARGAFVVSVDINSGLNGDTGLGETVVQSDLTVSLGAFQPGHFLAMAKDVMRRKTACDIGIEPVGEPYWLLEAGDLRRALKSRKNYSNKSTYGYVALVGGSERYGGAIRLANLAACAMRSGAGVVQLAVPRSLYPVVAPMLLESTLYPLSDADGALRFVPAEFDALMSRVRLIAFGMGVGGGGETRRAVTYLLEHYDGVLLLDADGLNALAELPPELLARKRCRLIVTPHLLEFSRLCGKTRQEISSAPIDCARDYARRAGAIVLLKGSTTVVTDGETVYLTDRGCAGMATAGSGDVLSGVAAALCAANRDDLLFATAAAAYVNGYAGELAERRNGAISMLASDTAGALREAVMELSREETV